MDRKVCFVAQFPPPIHGLSKAVETLYRAEAAAGRDLEKVDITSNRRFPANLLRILKSRADLFYFTISQTKGGNLRDLVILKALRMKKKPCLVHLHGGYYRQLADHDLPGWQRKANYRAMAGLAGAIVLGPSLKPIFEGMLPDEKIFIVPNCVDDEYLMSDEAFREKLADVPRQDVKHVLYLSNFIRTKGYPEVLRMACLEKEHAERTGERRLHFDFAGKFFEEAEEAFFRNFVRENGLEEYVTYHGVVSGEAKSRLLRECAVFVLLTRYPNEGQPISILEAMGNGMAVVTTDHAGIPDLVRDGVNGIVAGKDDAVDEAMLERMLSMVTPEVLAVNRREVKEKYSEERYVSDMDRILFGET